MKGNSLRTDKERKLERLNRRFNASQIIQIANYLNVSTDYLLGVIDVTTTDKDLQFVCDYTGLKEETIKQLSFEQNKHKNNLSSDNAFDEALNSIIIQILSLKKGDWKIKRFVFFTDEELKVIKLALYRTRDDYERGVWSRYKDSTEYEIAKKLCPYIQSILDEADND